MARECVLCVSYGVLALLIISANILIIVIFCGTKLRRRRTHFLLISLAVADLLVGILVLPLFIAFGLTSSVHVRFVSYHADIITGLTSIFTLAVISLERMYAFCWPARHQMLSRRAYILAVCIPWILVIAGVVIASLVADRYLTSILVTSSLVFPLIIICTSYSVIWIKQRNSSQHRSVQEEDQERKLAKTLLIIVGAFVGTWLPFKVINTYIIICLYHTSCTYPPLIITYVAVILRISNSFMNFVVYSLRIPDFREQLRNLKNQMCRKLCNRREEDLANQAAREWRSEVREDGTNRNNELQTLSFELTQL